MTARGWVTSLRLASHPPRSLPRSATSSLLRSRGRLRTKCTYTPVVVAMPVNVAETMAAISPAERAMAKQNCAGEKKKVEANSASCVF
jgi:hypothetical protein